MLIITGSLAWDYIMEFPGKFGDHILPEHIHNVNLSFIVNKFAKRRGGTAGNVSYSLGLLKTPHTLFSFAGNDFDEYKKAFEKIGIDCSHVAIDKSQSTATGFALTDAGNNQIWGYYYGAAARNNELQLSSFAKKDNLVLIGPQGAEGSMHIVRECIALKIPYMFDPGFILTQVSNKDLKIGIKHAAYIIGNEYEIHMMRQRIPDFTQITKTAIVIETLGEKGAVIRDSKKTYEIPPTKIKKISSTTGAGDAWRGGFLAGIERKFDLPTCGKMGAVAASFALENYGTQEYTFSIKEFQKRYRQNFGSLLQL